MDPQPRTINQWLIYMMPGLSQTVRNKLLAIEGPINKRGPVLSLPPHLKEKLPPDYPDGRLPNAFIAFDLNLPLPIGSDGMEEFLTPTFGELAENALREFIDNEMKRRDEGNPAGSKEYVVNVEAKIKTDSPKGPMYSIQLLDNGRGMPKDLVEYILDHIKSQRGKPYQLPLNYRVEETGKLIGGYGIVMAVNYVLRLQGAFSVRAIEGKGTKIRFDVPIESLHNIRKYVPA